MMDRQQGGGTFYSKFNRCRCLHYADNPLTDIVEYIEIPKDIDHHLAGTCVAVLFKKVDIPPTWVRPLTYTDGGHVASFIAALHNGTWMPERGYFQTYGDGEPFMPRSVIDMSPDDIVTSESENLNDYFDDEVVTGWKPNIEETKGFDTAGVMARQMAMMFPGMDSESIDGTLDSIFGKDYEDKVEPSEPDSKYGWIIRNGDFYKCKYHGHQNLARKIFRDVENMKEDDIPANAEEAGEKAGWVKLFKMMMDKKPTAYMAPGRHPTAKQTYTLEQWASHMKIPLEDVMDGL